MMHTADQIKAKLESLVGNYTYKYQDHPYYSVKVYPSHVDQMKGLTIEFGKRLLRPVTKLHVLFNHQTLSIRKNDEMLHRNYPLSIFMSSAVPGLFLFDQIDDCLQIVNRKYRTSLVDGLAWPVCYYDEKQWEELAELLITRDGAGFVFKREGALYLGVYTDSSLTLKTFEFAIASAKEEDIQTVAMIAKEGKHYATVSVKIPHDQSYEKLLSAFDSLVNQLSVHLKSTGRIALKTRWAKIQESLDDTSEALRHI